MAYLKYFLRRKTPKLDTPEKVALHWKNLIDGYIDFNRNYAAGSGSDGQWADPDTIDGMNAIRDRAEWQLEQDIEGDKIELGVDSIEDSNADQAEQLPDFERWLTEEDMKGATLIVPEWMKSNG